jgi:hypothetical protein
MQAALAELVEMKYAALQLLLDCHHLTYMDFLTFSIEGLFPKTSHAGEMIMKFHML